MMTSGISSALQLDDDAQAIFVRFIAQIGNAGDRLVVDQIGNLLDQTRFVDVVGNFIDDQPLSFRRFRISSTRITPRRINFAAACMIGLFDAAIAADDARLWENQAPASPS